MALINTTTTGVLGSTFFGDGAGPLTVQQNGVTQGIYGNIPAFSVYNGTYQSVTNNTITKLQLGLEEFDTNNNYDTTNYRFTPTVAGYYQFLQSVFFNNSASGIAAIYLYKNGSGIKNISTPFISGANIFPMLSTLVYANGTSDYFEIYVYQNTGGTISVGSTATSQFFAGYLVKAA